MAYPVKEFQMIRKLVAIGIFTACLFTSAGCLHDTSNGDGPTLGEQGRDFFLDWLEDRFPSD